LPIRAFIDIGGAGANSDAFVIWIVQWVDQQIRVLDYYEAVGQVLGTHIAWLRKNGYEDAKVYLPHDGVATNNITGKRYEDHIATPGSRSKRHPEPRQGRRGDAHRSGAPAFVEVLVQRKDDQPGRDALGFYHEKRTKPQHRLGTGTRLVKPWFRRVRPDGVAYEDPSRAGDFNRKIATRPGLRLTGC
jgi:phage terminase large subunit